MPAIKRYPTEAREPFDRAVTVMDVAVGYRSGPRQGYSGG